MSDAALHAAADQLGEDAVRETIRHRVEAAGTSFYWAMRLLPCDRRNGMYAIYAFCREVDDIADAERPVEHKLAALAGWREEIEALYEGRPRHLLAHALSGPVRGYELRKEDFVAILAGMATTRSGVPMFQPSTNAAGGGRSAPPSSSILLRIASAKFPGSVGSCAKTVRKIATMNKELQVRVIIVQAL